MIYLLIANWKNGSFLCFEFVWMCTVYTGTGCGRLITITIFSWVNTSLFIELWTGRIVCVTFWNLASTWPPPAQFLTLSQIKRWPAAAPGGSGRLCLSWLSSEDKPLYLPDLGQASLNPSLLKGQRKTESPCRSIHPSLISAFILLSLPDSLSFSSLCPSPCLIPSFFSQQWVKCSLVSQPAVPSHFLSSLFFHHIPLFLPVPFSASVSRSCSFSPSFSLLRLLQWHSLPCSDLINHIQTALCCFLSFYWPPSPFSFSNCLLFSLPVSRRKRFSLSNNKTQILIQCIHFLLQMDFIHVGLI